jgi:hypothetical protein
MTIALVTIRGQPRSDRSSTGRHLARKVLTRPVGPAGGCASPPAARRRRRQLSYA